MMKQSSALSGASVELSLESLLHESACELPERALMRHKKHLRLHTAASASADHGSVANSNSTTQITNNPVIVIGNGNTVDVSGNGNSNSTTQSGTVFNL